MATTKTIVSGENASNVGPNGTKIYTSTRITYTFDENGKIDPNTVKQEILYRSAPLGSPSVGATKIGTTGDWTFEKKLGFGEPVLGADAQKSLKEGVLKNTTQQQIDTAAKKEGLTPEQKKAISGELNKSSTNPNDAQTRFAAEQTNKEIKKELENSRSRNKYEPLIVYPEKLQLEYQDCIKFSMLKYAQSGLSRETTSRSLGEFQRSVNVRNGVPTIGTREILTTIVLPIPGGINDSNTVDWQADSLEEIARAFANIAQQTITGGGEGLQQGISQESGNAQKNIQSLQQIVASKFTEAATGTSRIMQRQYGAILNPNLELLFNGPQLRTFSFTFKLSPRGEKEAKVVQKIIRYFKQGMTPKRSDGYLLLQSPHTFAISYLSSNKQHPYLNKFKECALTNCSVNYTPEGNYMSYDGKERSMTSYEMTLQFQELVPLFDDDYGTNDTDIGF